jgi:hypothetical protein
MPRSMLAFALSVALSLVGASCAKTSDNPPVVTAPLSSGAPPATTSVAPALDTATAGDAGSAGATAAASLPVSDGGAAAFQACQADSDCIAVPRVGCCHNGYKEAVNVSQQDAYAASFTCPRRVPCPMFIIRESRVPRCDLGTHLCAMVQP